MINYATVSVQSTKKSLKPTDVMEFPWDNEQEVKKAEKMTKERYDEIINKFVKNNTDG